MSIANISITDVFVVAGLSYELYKSKKSYANAYQLLQEGEYFRASAETASIMTEFVASTMSNSPQSFSKKTRLYVEIANFSVKFVKKVSVEGLNKSASWVVVDGAYRISDVFFAREIGVNSGVGQARQLMGCILQNHEILLDVTARMVKSGFHYLCSEKLETVASDLSAREVDASDLNLDEDQIDLCNRLMDWKRSQIVPLTADPILNQYRCAMSGDLIRFVWTLTIKTKTPYYFDQQSLEIWIETTPNKAPENWPEALTLPLKVEYFQPDFRSQEIIDSRLGQIAVKAEELLMKLIERS